MLKKINLKGKTALVTGAGKGLGKACAIALAEAGLRKGNRPAFKLWMVATLSLGYIFVFLQGLEYYEAYSHLSLIHI